MDDISIVGKPLNVVKKQLEEQGFSVSVVDNYDVTQTEGSDLVVSCKKLSDKNFELIIGRFKFLN